MKHVDMRELPAAAQKERRQQVIGPREAGTAYDAIAPEVGLARTRAFGISERFAGRGEAGPDAHGPGPTGGPASAWSRP